MPDSIEDNENSGKSATYFFEGGKMTRREILRLLRMRIEELITLRRNAHGSPATQNLFKRYSAQLEELLVNWKYWESVPRKIAPKKPSGTEPKPALLNPRQQHRIEMRRLISEAILSRFPSNPSRETLQLIAKETGRAYSEVFKIYRGLNDSNLVPVLVHAKRVVAPKNIIPTQSATPKPVTAKPAASKSVPFKPVQSPSVSNHAIRFEREKKRAELKKRIAAEIMAKFPTNPTRRTLKRIADNEGVTFQVVAGTYYWLRDSKKLPPLMAKKKNPKHVSIHSPTPSSPDSTSTVRSPDSASSVSSSPVPASPNPVSQKQVTPKHIPGKIKILKALIRHWRAHNNFRHGELSSIAKQLGVRPHRVTHFKNVLMQRDYFYRKKIRGK